MVNGRKKKTRQGNQEGLTRTIFLVILLLADLFADCLEDVFSLRPEHGPEQCLIPKTHPIYALYYAQYRFRSTNHRIQEQADVLNEKATVSVHVFVTPYLTAPPFFSLPPAPLSVGPPRLKVDPAHPEE